VLPIFKMARPRANNYEEKRQLILDKAASLFAQQGFAGTSISSIAQFCGASKSLLYHYYQSKEALLFDMLYSHCSLLVRAADDAIDIDAKAEEQLKHLIRSLLNIYMGSRDKHVVLLNDLHCLPHDQQEQVRDLERRVVQVFKDLVGKLKPELSQQARTTLAMHLMGAINWTYTWFKPGGPITAQEFADLSTALFLNGLVSVRS